MKQPSSMSPVPPFTDQPPGSPLPCQTNHLGPYTLTRLLEKKLIDSGARVVTVASVLHRMVTIKDAMVSLVDSALIVGNFMVTIKDAMVSMARLRSIPLRICVCVRTAAV